MTSITTTGFERVSCRSVRKRELLNFPVPITKYLGAIGRKFDFQCTGRTTIFTPCTILATLTAKITVYAIGPIATVSPVGDIPQGVFRVCRRHK